MGSGGASGRVPAPGFLTGRVLDWRARRIEDPLERLRFLRHSTRLNAALQPRPGVKRLALGLVAATLLLIPASSLTRMSGLLRQEPLPPLEARMAATGVREVWLVEKKRDFEVYSNGLRIETKGAGSHEPRSFVPLDRRKPEDWTASRLVDVEPRTQPIGIVFHTTESHLAPFEEAQNSTLKKLGRNLLEFVRHNKSYHYLIDRFGRVWRVVDEDSAADHAGWSVWADRDWVYINLNHSFLGVAFEAQTRPGEKQEAINDAQIHAGRVLTEMLRARYGIRAENCVAHGQVSVNPLNRRIGVHTDWATGFPFTAMGLPDNYSLPLPSMTEFGFTYDGVYLQMSGASLWNGLVAAEETVRLAAAAQGMKVSEYKPALQRRYRQAVIALRGRFPLRLNDDAGSDIDRNSSKADSKSADRRESEDRE